MPSPDPRVLIDSHCHLDAAEFDADRDAVLRRARAAGVVAQVLPAVSAAGWDGLRRLCQGEPDLHPAYGLHPIYLTQHQPEHLEQLGDWIRQEAPCAVGECGLDFHVPGLDPVRQREYFVAQLAVARRFDLPVIVHARRALDEVIAALRKVGGLRGVVHSFSGSPEQARQVFALGFHVGIGGPVTYERAARLRAIVARMPLALLLLETDAPDQPLSTRRGARNEPAYLPDVARVVADLRGLPEDELAAATATNARTLFGLDARTRGQTQQAPRAAVTSTHTPSVACRSAP